MEIPQIARCFPDTNLQQPYHGPMTIGGQIPRSHTLCVCCGVRVVQLTIQGCVQTGTRQHHLGSRCPISDCPNNPAPTGRGFHQHHVVPSVRNRGDRGRALGGHLPLPERLQDYLLNANPSEAKQVRQSRLLVRSISF